MDRTNILLVGLPATGKSTYITALWAVEKDGKSRHQLTCDGLPSESSYIDGMRENWMVMKEVRRTSFAEPMEIVLPMKDSVSGKQLNLSLPDFKGEIFQNLIENAVSEDVLEWCDKSSGILCMVNLGNTSPEDFQYDVNANTNPKVGLEKVVMTSNDISPVIRNVLLLKYLWNTMGDVPIVLCFSLWDLKDCAKGKDVSEWIRENHPCLYNFVNVHFSKYKFYGLSAQGADYKELDDDSNDALAVKTTQKERAYIYTDHISYDITEPISFLIRK